MKFSCTPPLSLSFRLLAAHCKKHSIRIGHCYSHTGTDTQSLPTHSLWLVLPLLQYCTLLRLTCFFFYFIFRFYFSICASHVHCKNSPYLARYHVWVSVIPDKQCCCPRNDVTRACCHNAVVTLCEVTDWVTNPQGPNKPLERTLRNQYLGEIETNWICSSAGPYRAFHMKEIKTKNTHTQKCETKKI